MGFYSCSLLLECIGTGSAPVGTVWEESIVLVSALSEEEAQRAAEVIGKGRQVRYPIADGTEVEWIFRKVGSVFAIEGDQIFHGLEVYSRFLKESEVASLTKKFE